MEEQLGRAIGEVIKVLGHTSLRENQSFNLVNVEPVKATTYTAQHITLR